MDNHRIFIFNAIGSNEITHCLHNVYDKDAYSRVTIFLLNEEIRAGNELFRDSGIRKTAL
jgi:hypothetical protein